MRCCLAVKQSFVFRFTGKVHDIDFLCNLRQRFFPVPTLGFWVYNDRTAPEQHRIVDNEVVAKGLAAPK